MSVAVAQPIAGVSASRETEIEVIYPSVAIGGLGRLIGSLMGLANSIPTVVLRIVACLILGTLLAPLAVLAYALTKLFGPCYVLTNRSISSRSLIGGRLGTQIGLGEIADIEIETRGGYKFHRVGDLLLVGAQGNVLMTLSAISYPQRVRQIILDARQARLLSDQSLSHIQSRK